MFSTQTISNTKNCRYIAKFAVISPWFRRDFAKFLQVRRRQHFMISRKYWWNLIGKRRLEPIFRAGGSSGFLSQLFRSLVTKSSGFFVVPRWIQLFRRVWQEPSRSSKSARRCCFMSSGQMIGFHVLQSLTERFFHVQNYFRMMSFSSGHGL